MSLRDVDEVHVRHAYAFNRPIGNWDVSNVEDMYECSRASRSTRLLVGGYPGVTTLEDMFLGRDPSISRSMIGTFPASRTCLGCSRRLGVQQTADAWNPASVTAMDGMFKNATSFNQPLSEWSFPSVTRMHSMFRYAKAFDQDLGWCVDADMVLAINDQPDDVSSLFYLTKCAAASCGVAQEDANGTCPAPTALPTSLPTAQSSSTPTAPCRRPSVHPSVSPELATDARAFSQDRRPRLR